VVSVINMPDIDGLELSRVLQAVRPGLPIILITGHPELLRGSFGETDHFRLFTKPYDPDELLAAIGEMLGK
jgi:DNA-binding LytR/AlgR family response regulator